MVLWSRSSAGANVLRTPFTEVTDGALWSLRLESWSLFGKWSLGSGVSHLRRMEAFEFWVLSLGAYLEFGAWDLEFSLRKILPSMKLPPVLTFLFAAAALLSHAHADVI